MTKYAVDGELVEWPEPPTTPAKGDLVMQDGVHYRVVGRSLHLDHKSLVIHLARVGFKEVDADGQEE